MSDEGSILNAHVSEGCSRLALIKRPKLKLERLGSLSKNHVLYNTLSIEPNIQIIALDVQADKVQKDQEQAPGFRIIPVILKQLLTIHR